MIANYMIILVAMLHLLFGFLEMFARPDVQSKAFDIPKAELENHHLQLALSNQGIYNLAFGLMTIIMLLVQPSKGILTLLMGFVLVVGIYGGLTVTKKIWITQALPALIAMILVWMGV